MDKSQPVAWIKEGTLMYLGNYNYASITIQVQKSNSVGFDIPLYTQDQLEEARKLGMQQERAMWNLAESTQEIMDTHPVKEQYKFGVDWSKDGNSVTVLKICEDGVAEVVFMDYQEATHPVKEHFEDEPQAEELHEILQSNAELTNEEIQQVLNDFDWFIKFVNPFDFARAILRKASEK